MINLKPATPSLVGGDFNCVLNHSEKNGGALPNIVVMRNFFDAINGSNLEEATYKGQNFTWCNNQENHARIVSKLDKILINQELAQRYMGWSYNDHLRYESNLSPISSIFITVPRLANVSFRFHNAWVEHPEFFNVVASSWQEPLVTPHSSCLRAS